MAMDSYRRPPKGSNRARVSYALNSKEADLAEIAFCASEDNDREHFHGCPDTFHVRATLPHELRGLWLRCGVPGVPGGFGKWPVAIVVLRRDRNSIERIFSPVDGTHFRYGERAAFLASKPASEWWAQFACYREMGSGIIVSDTISLNGESLPAGGAQ